MPRDYYFQVNNPDVADEYHKELQAFLPNTYKGIKSLFLFVPPLWNKMFNNIKKEDDNHGRSE